MLGNGVCNAGYYAGWDKKGLETLDACKELCISETQCTYVAWLHRQSCSRYNGETCNFDCAGQHSDCIEHIVWKRHSGDIGTFKTNINYVPD